MTPQFPGRVLSFTGTSKRPPTPVQIAVLDDILTEFWNKGYRTLVHGEARNADSIANDMAKAKGYYIYGRPANISDHRCDVDDRAEPRRPLDRDWDIAEDANTLVAMPANEKEEVRSGTWATVRYARKLNAPIVIIKPNGDVDRERTQVSL
jgi:hypothetical protein